MEVGETYKMSWPLSALGTCGRWVTHERAAAVISSSVAVQSQAFSTIINDKACGMAVDVDGDIGRDLAYSPALHWCLSQASDRAS